MFAGLLDEFESWYIFFFVKFHTAKKSGEHDSYTVNIEEYTFRGSKMHKKKSLKLINS